MKGAHPNENGTGNQARTEQALRASGLLSCRRLFPPVQPPRSGWQKPAAGNQPWPRPIAVGVAISCPGRPAIFLPGNDKIYQLTLRDYEQRLYFQVQVQGGILRVFLKLVAGSHLNPQPGWLRYVRDFQNPGIAARERKEHREFQPLCDLCVLLWPVLKPPYVAQACSRRVRASSRCQFHSRPSIPSIKNSIIKMNPSAGGGPFFTKRQESQNESGLWK